MKKTLLSLTILSLCSSVFADNINVTPKATATLSSSCRISAINVNFGLIDVILLKMVNPLPQA